MHMNRDNLKKIRGLIGFTIFLLVLLWNYRIVYEGLKIMARIVSPFVLGLGIAFVLNLPVRFFENKIFASFEKMKRQLSLIVTLILTFVLIFGILFYIIPEFARSFTNIGDNMDLFLPRLKKFLLKIASGEPKLVIWISKIDMSWDNISSHLLTFMKRGIRRYGLRMETVRTIVSVAANYTIAFTFACYVVLQKERLGRQVKKVMYAFLPRDWTEIWLAFLALSNEIFAKFLSGQCLEAVLLGGLFLIMLLILRIPYAFLIAVVIAVTSLVPVFGAFMGCGIALLLIFPVSPVKTVVFLVLFLVLQQIEGDYIYPHVVGRSVGLPAIWVLVSVSIGAGCFGVIGMLLFIPIFSVLYSMLKGIVHRRLHERNISVE